LCFQYVFLVFKFLARPAKIPPKNQEAREANFAKYPPQTPSISQNFARVPHLHFCTPLFFKRLCGVQSVLPHFCFSRSTTLRVVALQRAGKR
jgi:hypothetical protein